MKKLQTILFILATLFFIPATLTVVANILDHGGIQIFIRPAPLSQLLEFNGIPPSACGVQRYSTLNTTISCVTGIYWGNTLKYMAASLVFALLLLSLAVGIKMKRSSLSLGKKLFIVLIAPCLLVVVIVQYFIAPQIMGSKNEANIKNLEAQLSAARYCTVDSDCVITTAPCPHDCSNPINKKEVERIQKLPGGLSCMSSSCRTDVGGVSCIHNTCTINWPTPSPDESIMI